MGGQDGTVQMVYAFQYINIQNTVTIHLHEMCKALKGLTMNIWWIFYTHTTTLPDIVFTEVIHYFTKEKKKECKRERTCLLTTIKNNSIFTE